MRFVVEATPVFVIWKSVEVDHTPVEEPMEKSVVGIPDVVVGEVKRERSAVGVEVPMPTRPFLSTISWVVVEPMMNCGLPAVEFTESAPQGVVVPMPTAPPLVAK